jgi:N-acyl homoserine lactone hydrolase
LKLHVLDTGTIDCADYALFSPDQPPGVHKSLSCRSYLVEHPDGLLVWDAGLPDAYAALPDGQPVMDVFLFRVAKTMAEQLAMLGVKGEDVDVLALSHLHNDHVGNVDLFGRAQVLMHEAERRAGYGPDPETYLYDPPTYAALDTEKITTVEDGHDVFGDGSVVFNAWPGHTPGHSALTVTLPETGVVVLGADIAHTVDNFEREIVSTLNHDAEESIRSIQLAKEWIGSHKASLWINHDLEQQASIRVVPESYS